MIPITRPELPPLEEFTALLEEIWESRMLSNFASFSAELEAIATAYLGVPARAVVSGDIGLVCAIAALGIPPGSTCLVPSFTFNSTVNALLWNDLVPVFVDIDPATLNMDPDAAAMAAAESDADLIVATHVFGNPADADRLGWLAEEAGAPLLFDAAHGYGSLREGQHVGGLGDAEVFSLSGTKPVTCAEGGLVTSHDEEFLERIEHVRAYGFQRDYNSKTIGINGKMSEIHAALGTLTLPRIDEVIEFRSHQVALYEGLLGDVPGLGFQAVRDGDRSTYKDFAVLFDSGKTRDAVEAALAEDGVQTKRYFRPCHRMDAFLPYATGPLPITEATYARVLCLPVFAALTDEQIIEISSVVETVARQHEAVVG
jgi:dTDP-4-amino-4,6-dideoxygalactose transaminase